MVFKKLSRSLIPWAVNLFGVMLVSYGISLSLLLLHIFGVVELTMVHGGVLGIYIILAPFAFGLEVIFVCSEFISFTSNTLLHLYSKMSRFHGFSIMPYLANNLADFVARRE